MNTGSPLSSPGGALDDKPPMCLSPQEKLKGSVSKTASLSGLVQRKKTSSSTSSLLAMDIDMTDLDGDLELELMDADDDHEDEDDSDHVMDDAGWISDDNLRALEFDERLNQEIDWVAHDDVEGSLKLQFVPAPDDEEQDFAFDPSSFLSPLRGSLSSFEVASSFAESLSVDTPPPSFGTSHDAEKLLMSFDTMNFTIPSPTSGSTKKRTSLFGKGGDKDADAKGDASATSAAKGSMSPSLKTKAGSATDSASKDSPLPKLAIPASEQLLGVLSITTPTAGAATVDPQKKIGSYSPEARRLRIAKFHEKRKNRTWKKSIKYDCRKKLADDRPRIKGRFVRVLENTPDAAAKEDDASSTASTASTGAASPRSVASPSPSTASTSDAASASPSGVTAVLATPAPVLQASPVINPVMQAVASALAAAATASSLSSAVSSTPAATKLTVVAPVPVVVPVAPSTTTTDATAAAQ